MDPLISSKSSSMISSLFVEPGPDQLSSEMRVRQDPPHEEDLLDRLEDAGVLLFEVH
jgi:hypothetical protein